jgi:alkanesulfonate monooxygenase SsuD/methylene tetrahydromethanopterin reductase-like flavin-dependent oxidoreductase (luciferase family)
MDGVWNYFEQEAAEQMLAYSFFGSPETIKADLQSFVDQTQVDEVMATSHIFDHAARLHSYELFAEILK